MGKKESRQLKQSVRFLTPAKINIFLNIVGRKANGYHELVLDLIPITLFDEIQLSPNPEGGLRINSSLKEGTPEDNLIIKTIRKLEGLTGTTFSLKINHQKNIPVGAGLGGGSGNAAGILIMLNRLFRLGLTPEKRHQLALELGTDVPFFLNPRPSIGRNLGEVLTPFALPSTLYLILVYPNIHISTKAAYRNCQVSSAIHKADQYTIPHLECISPSVNAFWNSLVQTYPLLKICRNILLKTNPVYSGLSGSGSTVFGIYQDKNRRDRAYSKLVVNSDWRVFSCETLDSFQYTDIQIQSDGNSR